MFFMPLAWKKFFLQHAENCVHTSVFARHGPKNIVTTVIFATRGKKTSQMPWYWDRGAKKKKHRYVRCCLLQECLKKCENTTYVTIFGGPQKCKNTMCCKNNKNKNNDDDDDDDHNNNNNNNNNKFRTTSSEQAQTCDKKMCYKVRYEKNIALCSAPARTRRAHKQHQCSHYYT